MPSLLMSISEKTLNICWFHQNIKLWFTNAHGTANPSLPIMILVRNNCDTKCIKWNHLISCIQSVVDLHKQSEVFKVLEKKRHKWDSLTKYNSITIHISYFIDTTKNLLNKGIIYFSHVDLYWGLIFFLINRRPKITENIFATDKNIYKITSRSQAFFNLVNRLVPIKSLLCNDIVSTLKTQVKPKSHSICCT